MAIEVTTTTSPGDYLTGAPNKPGIPQFIGNSSGKIVFSVDANGNGDAVKYAIYVEKAGSPVGYLDHTDGSDNGATEDWATAAEWGAQITATGLDDGTYYRFKAKSQNQDASKESVFSSYSSNMLSYVDLARSPESSAYSLEIPTGNTKVSGVSITGTSNVITISFTLTNKAAAASSVTIKTSPDDTTYIDRTGTVTGATTGLAALATGSAHTVTWATCTYLGNSYFGTLYVQVTPIDDAAASGAASVANVSIDNRPLATTISEIHGWVWDKDTTPRLVAVMQSLICGAGLYIEIKATDNLGNITYVSSAQSTDGFQYEQDHAGAPGADDTDTNWTAVPALGIGSAYINAVNRVRYTYQTALTAGRTYSFVITQCETVNVI